MDSNNVIAPYSSRGPNGNGLAKPDLVAPGGVESAEKIDTYRPRTGTSNAAPFVVGAIALMKQVRPNLFSDEIKTIIKMSATDIGYDVNTAGNGLLNAEAAVNMSSTWPDVVTLTHKETYPMPAPKGMEFELMVSLNNTGNIAANNTVIQIVDISPQQLNLVNDDAVHDLGAFAARTPVNSSWVLKANKKDSYLVTINLSSDQWATEQFAMNITVE